MRTYLPALLGFVGALTLTAAPAQANFASCVAGLKQAAVRAGISPPLAARALDGAKPDEKVVRFSGAQPEFKTPIWDYMAFLVDEERVRDGKQMLRKYDRVLRQVEQTYGVYRHVVVAVWGVETDYGKTVGEFFLPHALANLACQGGRRADFWRGEMIAALSLVQGGDLELNELYGSWAGAFGQTQFIPSTYKRLAVDFDGDGRRDLVRSVPDALGSTANYLRKSGWQPGEPWMIEVKTPSSYSGPSGRKATASMSTWGARGVVRADGKPLSGGGSAGLLLPAGPGGPGFLVFRNFNAIYSYNLAESYALAISHLADRLAGYPTLRTPWPTDDPGLSRAERLELQKLLNAKGFNAGTPDGKVGPTTQAAIARAEAHYGMEQTGRAGRKIYDRLGGKGAAKSGFRMPGFLRPLTGQKD